MSDSADASLYNQNPDFMKDKYNLALDAVSRGVKSAGELNACIKAIEF